MTSGQTWHIGLTRLVPRVRGGRWLCGALIFGALYGLFTVTGVFGTPVDGYSAANRSAALFFCVIIGYIVPVFHYISDRTVDAIDQLAPYLALDGESMQHVRRRVHHKTPQWFATALGIGL